MANQLDRAFAPHEEGERIDEDGLARAGFAGEQVESGAEGGDGVIDDGVVVSAQFDEHGGFNLLKTNINKGNRRSFDSVWPKKRAKLRSG